MNSVLLRQLDAMDAQIEVLKVMSAGIRHALTTPQAEEAPKLPTCDGIDDEDCGRRNPEAIHLLGGGTSKQRMCRGCGRDPVTGQAAK